MTLMTERAGWGGRRTSWRLSSAEQTVVGDNSHSVWTLLNGERGDTIMCMRLRLLTTGGENVRDIFLATQSPTNTDSTKPGDHKLISFPRNQSHKLNEHGSMYRVDCTHRFLPILTIEK